MKNNVLQEPIKKGARNWSTKVFQQKLTFDVEHLDFYKLKFLPGYSHVDERNRRRISFSSKVYENASGIIVIRERSTHRLAKINKSSVNLMSEFRKFLFRKKATCEKYEYCLLLMPIHLIEKACNKIRESYMEKALTETFLKIKCYLDQGKEIPNKTLRFVDAFQDDHRGGHIRTLGYYKKRAGIYFIKENTKIVYIGRASDMTKRCYNHFCESNLRLPSQVSYFPKLATHRFKISFIEFPRKHSGHGELSYGELKAILMDWEKKLIAQFNPRDNSQNKHNFYPVDNEDNGFAYPEYADPPF